MAKRTRDPEDLIIASYKGEYKLVESLLLKKAYIDHQDMRGFTSLCVASQNGHLDVVKLLISKKADPLLGTKSSLLLAIEKNQSDIAKWLWNNVFFAYDTTETLGYAIKTQKFSIVKDYFFGNMSIPPHLFFACTLYGHYDVVHDSVIRKHLNPNMPVVNGWTAVFASVKHVQILNFFMTKCWDGQRCNGYTFLMLAAQWDAIYTIEWLLKNQLNCIDECITESNIDKQVITGKTKEDFNIYPVGFTSLAIAVMKKHLETVKLIINMGANIFIPLPYNKTLLHIAVEQSGSYKMIEFISSFFGNCTQQDDYKKCAIDYSTDIKTKTLLLLKMKSQQEIEILLHRMFLFYCQVFAFLQKPCVGTIIASYLNSFDNLILFRIPK